MKFLFLVLLSVSLSGCLASFKEYRAERTDMEITGNKGCLKGACKKRDAKPKKILSTTRLTNILEVELGKHDKGQAVVSASSDASAGEYVAPRKVRAEKVEYVEEEDPYEKDIVEATRNLKVDQPIVGDSTSSNESSEVSNACSGESVEYVIAKGDTLQKISSKFFGTTKKYIKIYEFNKDKLKSVDAVVVGKKINIPCN